MVYIIVILVYIIVTFLNKIAFSSNTLAKSKKIELVDSLLNVVDSLSNEDKKKLLDRLIGKDLVLLSVFKGSLSGFEALVLFLKKYQKRDVKSIASLLKREKSTIYATLSKIKQKKATLNESGTIKVPISIFSNRKFSVLESLVSHLKDEMGMSLKEISVKIGKSYSTVKTVYWRYKKKCQ